MTPGDTVTILPPFDAQFPGEHIVQSVDGAACRLENGVDFDEQFLTLVKASDGNYTPPPAPPAPVSQRLITELAFRQRFTQDEQRAIYTAAKSSVDVQIYLDDMRAAAVANAGNVNLDDPLTSQGVAALEAAGLITAGRSAEILA